MISFLFSSSRFFLVKIRVSFIIKVVKYFEVSIYIYFNNSIYKIKGETKASQIIYNIYPSKNKMLPYFETLIINLDG